MLASWRDGTIENVSLVGPKCQLFGASDLSSQERCSFSRLAKKLQNLTQPGNPKYSVIVTACIMKKTTAIELNNEGVLHLDAGNYEKAAYSFKEASKLIFVLVAKELQAAMASKPVDNDEPQSQEAFEYRPQPQCVSPEKKSGQEKRKVPFATEQRESCEQTRPLKRARTAKFSRRSEDITSPCNVIGRPLWMKQPSKGKKGFRATTEAAIILYNLGLTFHLNAVRLGLGSKGQWMYRRSLDLYNMAKELILGSPATHAFESPVFLVALHNMAIVHSELRETKKVESMRKELAAVLRLLRASNLVGVFHGRGYEGFYLKLLSLSNGNELAAAA